jgi:hypothetical protein
MNGSLPADAATSRNILAASIRVRSPAESRQTFTIRASANGASLNRTRTHVATCGSLARLPTVPGSVGRGLSRKYPRPTIENRF